MAIDVFTIDFIVLVLSRSIFNPFVAWMIPLCLRAVATPYHDPAFVSSCAWAALLVFVYLLSLANHRLAYGRPRGVNWADEVVVITGGASGLGRVLAEMYGMRGASVAILDVNAPAGKGGENVEDGGGGGSEALWQQSVKWYRCDVGSAADVEDARRAIEKDLGRCTVLINNAGIVNGKPLLEISAAEMERNFRVNLIAHFNTIHAFLPGMLNRESSKDASEPDSSDDDDDDDGGGAGRKVSSGGTIVTIASVLGKIPPACLTDYTAAKAGLIAMHHSLRAELQPSSPDIKLVLVCPGQLSTPLFKGVETPSSFFGPVVEPVDLAREIVKVVDRGEAGEISMPLYARYIEWVNVLPGSLQRFVRFATGVDVAMQKGYLSMQNMARKRQ